MPKSSTKADAKSPVKPISKPDAKASAKPEGKTAGKPEAKAPAKPEPKPTKPEAKAPTKVDAKAAAKPEAKSPAKPDSKAPKSAAGSAPAKGPAKPGVDAGNKNRYSVMSQDVMAASRAAAAKLAAAAGLHPVKSNTNGESQQRNYTKMTKTPFSKKELDEFREMLLTKRKQIEGDVNSMESEALGSNSGSLSHMPQHMADQGTDTFDQSLALDLAASQRGLLREIDDALKRIEDGMYGICEEMGKPISVERLRHTPWARYCIEAARQHERAAYLR
ncbi:MAG: TraR/DksA C4-type zinc finger protein [Planctomycetota bacterium]|nr:TraR/DksA C4-type zinc finger protein [Planctomycetota bacterium]